MRIKFTLSWMLLLVCFGIAQAQTGSVYANADAIVQSAHPDSIIDQSAYGGNILAWREYENGSPAFRTQSYVIFDLSGLKGQQIESASVSYRGKVNEEEFANDFIAELWGVKASFDPETVTFSNRPSRDKRLATSPLNTSSARKSFENINNLLVDYLNNELRKGATQVGFMVRSSGRDSTTSMWLGGAENGSFAPILDYSVKPSGSQFSLEDAIVSSEFPDSIIDQSAVGGNMLAYVVNVDGSPTYRVQSYVKFDISGLKGQQVETAALSYRGKVNEEEFANDFGLEVRGVKADFDAETVTYATRPSRDRVLGTSFLNTSSARKTFENDGSRMIDYVNEAVRRGDQTITFLIRSTGVDSTSNMWLGGTGNGSFGPIFDYTVAPAGSQYSIADAVVNSEFPDSTIDQSAVGGNMLSYVINVDGSPTYRIQSYIKFDISGLKGQQVETASLSYRGKVNEEEFADNFGLEVRGVKADFDAETVTYATRPSRDRVLGTSFLNTSSARKTFENDGSRMIDYINEAVRRGDETISFLIRSTGVDSTSNMWLGGTDNGSFGPTLDYTTSPAGSAYSSSDAVVNSEFPDSTIDQSTVGGNMLSYVVNVDGEPTYRTQSYVKFDISGLKGQQVESASLSYRGKVNEEEFADDFGLEVRGVKADFDAETVTYATRPSRDRVLGTSFLNTSSARKSFENDGSRMVDYVNEALRRGDETIAFLIRSTGVDSTSNMWLGGTENGSFGPILDFSVPNIFSVENDTIAVVEDVYVSQAEPDVNFETGEADMHLIFDGTNSASKDVYLKFPIAGTTAGVGTATLIVRGAQQEPPTAMEDFVIEVYGTADLDWLEEDLTWNNVPETTTGVLANYNITESAFHPISSDDLTAYVNAAINNKQSSITFRIRGAAETSFRAWISSKDWQGASLALDYSTQTKGILDDTYVAQASPDENFNGVTAMQIAKDEDNSNDRETYLKFDISDTRSSVISTTLVVRADQENTGIALDDFFIQVFGVTDNSWSDSTLTWNNKPASLSNPLLIYNVQGSANHELSSEALTNFIKSEINKGTNSISFVVKGRDNTPGSNAWISDQGWRPAQLLFDYRKIATAPEFITAGGDYVPNITVTLDTETAGGSIYYTTDGSDPTDASTLYTEPFVLTDTTTVKAITYADGLAPSSISEATYNVAPVGIATFSPTAAVEYTEPVTVMIEVAPADAFIFYSTDGGDPLTPYPNDGLLITETTNLRARGVSADGNSFGPISEITYTIVNTVPGTGSGPGGVGASDNSIAGQPENALWLSAGTIDAEDGAQVTEWADQSGNGNDAYNDYVEGGSNRIDNTGETQKPAPTYIANGPNGQPVLQFGTADGTEEPNRSMVIDDADNLDGGAGISLFMVMKRNEEFPDFASLFQKRDITSGAEAQAYILEFNGGANPNKAQFVIERQIFLGNNIEYNAEDYYIINVELQGDFGQAIYRTNGEVERVAAANLLIPAVDAPAIIAGAQPMNVAEIVMYKKGLNAAQNAIVHNYLATKYDIELTDGEMATTLYVAEDFTADLIGVGKDTYIDGTTEQEHRSASGAGLQLDVRSELAAGDYVLAAHNGAMITDNLTWERYWNVEAIGGSPTVNMSFDFVQAGAELPTSTDDLRLFYNDGNGWADLELAGSFAEGKLQFTIENLQSGQYALGQNPPTSTNYVDRSEQLAVYPNPIGDEQLMVELINEERGEVILQVFDAFGRLVANERSVKQDEIWQTQLDLDQLSAGIYTLRLIQNGTYQAVRQVVKQ
ncbi:MAG: DNRLRE domain-containing protein [Bacteroidota bacterium]